jgi:hypothetical protein
MPTPKPPKEPVVVTYPKIKFKKRAPVVFPRFRPATGTITVPAESIKPDVVIETTTPSWGTPDKPYPPCKADRDKPNAKAAVWKKFKGTWHDPDGTFGPSKGYWTNITGICGEDTEVETIHKKPGLAIQGGLNEEEYRIALGAKTALYDPDAEYARDQFMR